MPPHIESLGEKVINCPFFIERPTMTKTLFSLSFNKLA
jgi:hypothetical protein